MNYLHHLHMTPLGFKQNDMPRVNDLALGSLGGKCLASRFNFFYVLSPLGSQEKCCCCQYAQFLVVPILASIC